MTTRTRLAAAVVLLLLPTLAACSAGGDDAGGGGGSAPVERAEDTGGGGGGQLASQSATSNTAAGTAGLRPVGPRVVQTASLRLSIARGDYEDAVDRARMVAAGLGGFVVSSATSRVRGAPATRGSLVLRVPERTYARAMSALAEIGRVQSRTESGQDVSQEFVDLAARARHLEAVERQLLELLDRARTVPAALAVQSQLNETQLQLEQVRGRLRYLEDQTAFATISLALVERVAVPGGGRGWGIVEAWRDGAHAFVYVLGRAFVVAAAVAPFALLLAAALVAGRALRRRGVLRWGGART